MKFREVLQRLVKPLALLSSTLAGFDLLPTNKLQHPDRFLKTFLKLQKIDFVFDIGANKGEFIKTIRGLGFEGLIVAIEPGPQAFRKLQALTKKDKKVILLNLAAGQSAGFQTLYQFSDDALNSLHEPNDRFHKRYGNITKTSVIEVTSLDRLIDELITQKLINIESKGFLKIDVQGSELEVLDGGVKSWRLFQGIQIELNALALYNRPTSQTECFKKMEELGFGVGSFMPVSREGFALIDYDAIFVRYPN